MTSPEIFTLALVCFMAGLVVMAALCGYALDEMKDKGSICYRPRLLPRRGDGWND